MLHGTHIVYLLERIRDGGTHRKGERIWALQRCKGWRVIRTEWTSF